MKKITLIISIAAMALCFTGCSDIDVTPVSSSGVTKATTKVQTDLNGRTSEQNNIIGRYAEDNKPGSIKHLYIISTYSGQVIMYSTVKGKVTSSGKRLTPNTVQGLNGSISSSYNWVQIGGKDLITDEVIQDDGTYGSSVEYIYWWDSKGAYHQQYIAGGMMVHISNQPIAVKNITINVEAQ